MGARAVEAAARQAVEELGLDAAVCRTGCIGFCASEPLLDLVLPGGPRVSYANMTPEKTRDLLAAYAARRCLQPEPALGRFAGEEHVSTGEVARLSGRRRRRWAACPSGPAWISTAGRRRSSSAIAARSTR